MKTTKYLLVLFLSIFFIACSNNNINDPNEPNNPESSTHFLSGTVVINGEPVNAAVVLLTPGGGTYITGSDGFFSFPEIPAGTYEIKVYKEGCQPFNKTLTIDKNYQEMALTITENTGSLHLNKSYIDMGSNESNNMAAFTITNNGNSELTWQATSGARWITKIEPANGTIPAGGSAAVSFIINRDRFSQTALDNHTAIVVRSTTAGDGSLGELLVTAFGQGNGTNTANDNSDLDYVMVGDLYVQTVDISDGKISSSSAERLCNNSIKGGYNDWRLPTIDELATIYENRAAIGGFNTDDDCTYWAAFSQSSRCNPRMDFRTGQIYAPSHNDGYNRVRAVRKDPVDHLPKVSTLDITTSGNSVVLNGKVEDDGLPKYTERGFVISSQPVPTFNNGTKYVVDGQTTSNFQYILEDVEIGKIYYIVAYATNTLGTTYGSPVKYVHHHYLYYYIPELNLMIQRGDLGSEPYTQAVTMCKNSRVGGFSDWRLPTLDECKSIYQNMGKYDIEFVNANSYCWTSTLYIDGYNYIYKFDRGTQSYDYNDIYSSYSNKVRAVRTVK